MELFSALSGGNPQRSYTVIIFISCVYKCDQCITTYDRLGNYVAHIENSFKWRAT